MNEKVKAIYSWPAIILAFILFWPVGIFLLVKRLKVDKKGATGAGKTLNIIGYISFGLALLGTSVCISDGFESSDISAIIFLLSVGAVMCSIARKLKKNAEKTRNYMQIIVNGSETRLDYIANAMNIPYDTVVKDLKQMIDTGYFRNGYVDTVSRKLVLPNRKNSVEIESHYQEQAYITTPVAYKQTKTVTCKCCGAKNVIETDVGECEYCGSPL